MNEIDLIEERQEYAIKRVSKFIDEMADNPKIEANCLAWALIATGACGLLQLGKAQGQEQELAEAAITMAVRSGIDAATLD